jgi:hypothetical protein
MFIESLAGIEPNRINRPASAIAFARLDCQVSLSDLEADIALLLHQPWVTHVNRRDYQGDWEVLPLRCKREHANAHPILQGFAIESGDEWRDLPQLQKCPAIGALLAGLDCPLKAVRLMRLQAGAFIKPHRDDGLSIEYGEARLHLPIHYSNEILFKVDHQLIPMRAGELWYINVDREHEVRNHGQTDRINLVIDCIANDWLHEQIYSASVFSCCDVRESKP